MHDKVKNRLAAPADLSHLELGVNKARHARSLKILTTSDVATPHSSYLSIATTFDYEAISNIFVAGTTRMTNFHGPERTVIVFLVITGLVLGQELGRAVLHIYLPETL